MDLLAVVIYLTISLNVVFCCWHLGTYLQTRYQIGDRVIALFTRQAQPSKPPPGMDIRTYKGRTPLIALDKEKLIDLVNNIVLSGVHQEAAREVGQYYEAQVDAGGEFPEPEEVDKAIREKMEEKNIEIVTIVKIEKNTFLGIEVHQKVYSEDEIFNP